MTEAKLTRYQSTLFDSDHWTRVHLRAGDVVVSTPPKSGTTWTLAMIYLLLHGSDAHFDSLSRVAPWIDASGAEAAPQGHGRRLFKTHTPLDGIPIADAVRYIAVFRDPGASFLSMRRHLANMMSPLAGHPNAGPWPQAFETFLTGPICPARFGGITLPALQHYLRCARASATLVLHYADLIADPRGGIRQLARHLGVPCSEPGCQKIARITNQDNMAHQADRFTPEGRNGFFKENAHFFTSAQTAEERLAPHEIIRLRARIEEAFDPAEAAWLTRGH